MKKSFIFELSLALALCIAVVSASRAEGAQVSLADKLVRIHIIANSNSENDQELKLKVRDRLLSYAKDLDLTDKAEALEFISGNTDAIREIAEACVRENGYAYDVEVSLSKVYFPTRDYGSFTLPAGYYDALRVMIGKAEGRNWWCVMFPPLCIDPAGECESDLSCLTPKERELVRGGGTVYKYRFKLMEIIGKIKKNAIEN